MANHFPDASAVSVSGLRYSVHLGLVTGIHSAFQPQDFIPVTWDFTVVNPITQAVTYDASWFDQDAYEVTLVAFLNGLCAVLAGNLGVTAPDVQRVVVITRIWSFDVAGITTITESDTTMTYPQ